ncbi:adenosylcobinamide-phosphate synthase CbiB [Porphyromonas somerae]|uniref:adenosylcobinamide-phosphate synthase CbiB n=1 Tax=Porphyromonas somerae TaxID=322095 RepID=UPI00036DAF88|nr:adenosylcobinamide-phosphate synthase CbiB [Porphyromonas somerae]
MLTYYSLQALFLARMIMLWLGWLLDRLLGDPERLPHLIVGFGKVISWAEGKYNHGEHRRRNGAMVALSLILAVALLSFLLIYFLPSWLSVVVGAILVYYCLAGTTLIEEVEEVFRQLAISLPAGREQLSRIVGRDTDSLTEEECKVAALETLSENLSDGVVAPLFWFLIFGVPGIVAYKMINTLDSMIGYKNERYGEFGYVAAKIDDVANWIPARITALLMLVANRRWDLRTKVFEEGRKHTSPNSGYPEAALALMLGCQFGGTHAYGGRMVEKPTIGSSTHPLTDRDLKFALQTNRKVEVLLLLIISAPFLIFALF